MDRKVFPITDDLPDVTDGAAEAPDSVGEAIVSTDVNGNVTYLNAAAETMTGWSRESAIGHPLEEVLHLLNADTHDVAHSRIARTIRENKIVSESCLLVRGDGVEVAVEDSAAPIRDAQGHTTGVVMVFHDISVARVLTRRMLYLTQHDSLTDLPNRVLLSDRLAQAVAVAKRERHKLALLFLDLDRFKHLNDSLGQDIGDRLLRSVAQRLVACVRGSDTVSRLGGDEFAILLSTVTHAEDAAVCAEKILAALRKPHLIDQHDLHVTASVGIVTYPDDAVHGEALMRHAHFAMYYAKDSGRDNYQFFEPAMNVRATERQAIENDLRHALQRQEFILHYQPSMDLQTGAIVGVEALIRWRHPGKRLVSPAQFIPVAEECGFIVPIGRWALREACLQLRIWQDAGIPPIRMAVNMSAAELRAKDFVAAVRAIIRETNTDPSLLVLELTETFLLQDATSTAAVLRALKATGVQLALDDFGTGYSSLSHLKRFPIDILKIDRSFVRHLTTDVDDASIVNAVINMGKNMHLRVVAEGVETREQLAFLQERGCEEGQGLYFSPPVNAAKLTVFIQSRIAEPLSAAARVSTRSRPARKR